MNADAYTDVQLLISAEAACFRRVEFAVDLVTYDAPPPPTINRLLANRAPHGSRWQLHHITIVNKIDPRWIELGGKLGVKRVLALVDVQYVIGSRWWFADPYGKRELLSGSTDPHSSHLYLGLREFPATVSAIEGDPPMSRLHDQPAIDLGWMPYELKGAGCSRTRYFRPVARRGMIDLSSIGVLAS